MARALTAVRRIAAVLLAALCVLSAAVLPAYAAQSGELPKLRVGYLLDPGFLEMDSGGTCRGYLAEYLTNIALRAGFQLEYVPCGTSSAMFAALEDGTIDIIPDCMKTEEREAKYLFCQTEIGAINDALIVRGDDDRYDYGEVDAVSGMKVAAIGGYATTELFRSWLKKNGLTCDIQEYDSYAAVFSAVRNGNADATLYGDGIVTDFRTIFNFASSPFYIALKAGNLELKKRLDEAMSQILAENMLYEVQLYNKYFGNAKSGRQALSRVEKNYLASHRSLNVAVIENDAPYFSRDSAGKDRGILPDYYAQISEKTGISFTFKAYRTQDDAVAAVKSGEADLLGLFTTGILSAYNIGLRLTVPYTTANAVMITRSGTDPSAVKTVVVKNRYISLIREKKVLDDDVVLSSRGSAAACFEALRSGKADAVICGMPSATWLLNQTNSSAYAILPVSSLSFELCGALLPKNRVLCSILNKMNYEVSGSVDGIVERNTLQENTWRTFIARIPPAIIVLVTGVLLALILGLVWTLVLLMRRHRERAAVLAAQAETERQRIQLEALRKNAEERNLFFSNISHDMRTPLNAIIGFAGLAEKEAVSEKARNYLSKIKLSGNLLLNLINDTLTISKMNSGKLELHPEPVDTDRIMEALTASVIPAAEEKGIVFTVDDSGVRRRTILADKLNLQKLFLNLLSNAVKFTPPGGHVWYIAADEPQGSPDPDIAVTIRDDGIGMSQEYQTHLYEPFSQERRTGYESMGTGLGLSIVRQLVDLMGGAIEVHSERDRGTEFIVRLHLPEVESAAPLPPRAVCVGADFSGKRVLLCEDNALNREIAVALLRSRGMAVVTADNGQEGLRLFSDSTPGEFDLILMDLRMPVMGGLTAAAAIRALERADAPSVPIVAMTADAFADDVQSCLDAGMNAHIAKPIDPELLFDTLCSVLSAGGGTEP